MKANQSAVVMGVTAIMAIAGGAMTVAEKANAESFTVDGNQSLNTNNSFRKIDGQPRMSTWQSNGNDPDQQFDRLTGNPKTGGTLLRQRSTGKCLNAYRVTNGSEINVWPCNANDADQNFNLLSQGNGYFMIQKTGTNQCVDSPERVNGGKIHMWQCISGISNQRWRSSNQAVPTPAPTPAPAPTPISGQPDFSLGFYRQNNIFWNAGYAPASTNPPNPKLGLSKGNCTWYASGRAKQWGRNGANVDKLSGNAYDWGKQAANAGLRTSNTPERGAIAQWDYGHVAIVESVNGDGTITISESSYSSKLGSSIDYLYNTRRIAANNPTRYIMP